MGRQTKHPRVMLMLSPAAVATACGLDPNIIYNEILAGRLEVKTLPGTIQRRVLVSDVEVWFRKFWIPAPRKRKSAANTHAGEQSEINNARS
jgi:hypothetical protein